MQTVSIKELRDNLAQLIEEVAIAKKHIEITKFGKRKALLIPASSGITTKKRGEGLEISFGAWKNRTDIKDTSRWVARLRRKASSRYGKLFS